MNLILVSEKQFFPEILDVSSRFKEKQNQVFSKGQVMKCFVI